MTEETFSVKNRICIVILTKLLVLVTLKKSSIRVCLLCPATDSSSFLSSRLLSRVLRNFSIRWRTLISLKIHQQEHSHCCLEEEAGEGGQSPKTRTWHAWHGRGSQPVLPHLARSSSVLLVLCPLYQETVSVLLRTSRNVALDGSNRKQTLVSSLKVHSVFFLQCKAGAFRENGVCVSGTFLFTCKTTFSMVRCFWMSVRALFGPNPAILSQ